MSVHQLVCRSQIAVNLCVIILLSIACTAVEENCGVTGTTPEEVFAQLGLGWNLGNHFDSHAEGAATTDYWDLATPTQATFDAVKAAGFSSVRIPVTWMGHIDNSTDDYIIDNEYLALIASAVDMAHNAGLNVVINMHHDGADSAYWLSIAAAAENDANNAAIKLKIEKVWTQIAEYFNDYGQFLVFEAFNEIHDGGWGWGANRSDDGRQYAILNEWNQLFVNIVRATGGQNTMRMLGIPGYCTNPNLTIENLVVPTDNYAENRIMVAVHFYDPTDYVLSDTYGEWGHTATDKASWGDEEYLVEIFAKLNETFVSQGVPVYIGEFGNVNRATDRAKKFRKYYLEYLCRAAHKYKLAPFFWDNNVAQSGAECSGMINHSTGEFYNDAEEVIALMVKAIASDDESYTLETVYDSAP